MNRVLLILLFLFGLKSAELLAVESGTREPAFVRALELFDSAKSADDYRESANVLESMLADGFQSGAVYYNLGNAYYRAGEFGRAILNYRKAKPYRPRDSYLAANLEQALSVAPGRLSEPPRPWWNHVLFWTDWVSVSTKLRSFFLGMSSAAVLTALAIVFRVRRLRFATFALVLVSVVIGIDGWLCDPQFNPSRRAVITGETIARKGIGNSYEPAFNQPLRDGAEFQILEETSDWTFGHFGGIGDGWVRNEFVAR